MSTQQTAALILDVNKDGLNDFVVGVRQTGPAMVWYERGADGWTRHLIDDDSLPIEAGGTFHDIDGDGDLDIVMGADAGNNRVWWWENPYPDYASNTSWTRREIKNSGQNKHHDQMFGDFDGDGLAELVFWNQGAKSLFLAEIPASPRTVQPWPYTAIYTWSDGSEHEGLAQADVDGDGKTDIVGGGRWFKHEGGTTYTPQIVDESQAFSRAAAGQLKPGGRPEIVFVVGDGIGQAKWYEWNGSGWSGTPLINENVDHGHSLQIADVNDDGDLDIFLAEMRLDGGNSDARMWLFEGNSQGDFVTTEIATGYGNHESKVGDLDGDGDLDILGKPYNWETPRVDIWLNQPDSDQQLGQWRRHVVDDARPWRAIFISAADVDGDNHQDILTGGWWYRNPGATDGTWQRQPFGSPLNNMATAYDFDEDGDVDVLGTGGQGSDPNATFVWGENNGSGDFTIHDNVAEGDGDFLQGVAVAPFSGAGLEVALSWHAGNKGVQRFRVPDIPATDSWPHDLISPTSQDEQISAGDIDRDGDFDLLLGTRWLRNDGGSWSAHVLSNDSGSPDRNRLADVNGDGRLDAVVGFEAISVPGKLAWYEQGEVATAIWTEHLIADPAIIGPMSVDVADMDGDGDVDVVAGEHNTDSPESASLYVFENVDGSGTSWQRYTVYTGDEHHDGAQLIDIDGDGDLDIISIGWTHDRVVLYENLATDGGTTPPPSETPPPPETERVTAGQQLLYMFEEGDGDVVGDQSAVQPALPLTVANPAAVSWLPDGGLSLNAATIIKSGGAAQKIVEAAQASNEITLEAWVRPANQTQHGPARILTLSLDPNNRNFTLAQEYGSYEVRLRTTSTSENGMPALATSGGAVGDEPTHVVYTRATDGKAHIYVNGAEAGRSTVGGTFSNWDGGYPLALGNELTEDRPWLGELYLVAVFDRALRAEEVLQNYRAGWQSGGEHFLPAILKQNVRAAAGSAAIAVAPTEPALIREGGEQPVAVSRGILASAGGSSALLLLFVAGAVLAASYLFKQYALGRGQS